MRSHPIWRPATPGSGFSAFGIAASVVVHLALIGVSVYTTREPGHYAEGGSTEFVRYLFPPDRLPRRKIETERVEWMRIGIPEGWGVSDVAGELAGSEIDAAPRRGERGGDPELDRPHPKSLDELLGADVIFSALEVDSTVVRSPESGAPFYPSELLALNVEGAVRARYVVDTSGKVDSTSFEIVEASHPAFAHAVLEAVPRMRFKPAVTSGRRVPQLVEQTFEFRVSRRIEQVSLRAGPDGDTLARLLDDPSADILDHAP